MKSFKGILLIASLLLSQLAFAQKDNRTNDQIINDLFVAPLNSTNNLIQKDIDDTKSRIQKLDDASAQADEIRSLLLRTVGRMTSYTPLDYNLHIVALAYQSHIAALADESFLIPYYLIGAKGMVSDKTPWFEFMKDASNVPQFNKPLLLIDTIKKNFTDLVTATDAMIVELQKKGEQPDQDAQPTDPGLLTKYLIKHHRSAPQSI